MNARHTTSAALAAAFALFALGCAGRSTKDLLPGAVYAANSVQVYRNAELTNMMGSESYGDEPDSYVQGQTWYFDVKDPKEKVLAFYEQQFPGAERTTNDDGSIKFQIVPEGAEKNEYVYVTVGDGKIWIGERCRPGKIKD